MRKQQGIWGVNSVLTQLELCEITFNIPVN